MARNESEPSGRVKGLGALLSRKNDETKESKDGQLQRLSRGDSSVKYAACVRAGGVGVGVCVRMCMLYM